MGSVEERNEFTGMLNPCADADVLLLPKLSFVLEEAPGVMVLDLLPLSCPARISACCIRAHRGRSILI